MKIALIAIGVLMVVATVLPLLRKDAWWVRIFDFPRLQITFITAITLATYLLFNIDSRSVNSGIRLLASVSSKVRSFNCIAVELIIVDEC